MDVTHESKKERKLRLARERKRRWRERNPDKSTPEERRRWQRAHHLRKKYGLTLDDYDALLREQGNVCAICRGPETQYWNGTLCSLSVDHCHDTGAVRGLLCRRCNRSLHGVEWHRRAIRYLEG